MLKEDVVDDMQYNVKCFELNQKAVVDQNKCSRQVKWVTCLDQSGTRPLNQCVTLF